MLKSNQERCNPIIFYITKTIALKEQIHYQQNKSTLNAK